MKKRIILILAICMAFSLCACGTSSETTIVVDESQPFEVTLSISNIGKDGKPVFNITSNLPDKTNLILTLENTSGYSAQDKITLKSGNGSSDTFTEHGNPLSGLYLLEIIMPMPSVQDEEVQNIIGSNGEFITGNFVKESNIGDGKYKTIEAEYDVSVIDQVVDIQQHNSSASKVSLTAQETCDLIESASELLGEHATLITELFYNSTLDYDTIHSFEQSFRENSNKLNDIAKQMTVSTPHQNFAVIWDEYNTAISTVLGIEDKLVNWDTNGDGEYDNDEVNEIINQAINDTREIKDNISKLLGDFIKTAENYNSNPPKTDTIPDDSDPTIGQQNALKAAKAYLSSMPFSYTGIIEQLEYEKYSHEEAVYAAKHCGADWKEQAALCAYDYLNSMSFSRQGLIEQLQYEGFTYEQAVYGVEQNGY